MRTPADTHRPLPSWPGAIQLRVSDTNSDRPGRVRHVAYNHKVSKERGLVWV